MQYALSNLWLKLAGLYFFIGVALGVGMGLSGDHRLFALHAHINLLGWVSMALFGLITRVLGPSRLLRAHFWVYNLSLPVMSGGLLMVLSGHPAFEPMLGMGSLGVSGGVVLFVIALFLPQRQPQAQIEGSLAAR